MKFLAAVAGVNPDMPGIASERASGASGSQGDPRGNVLTKGPLGGRKRAAATTARRVRVR